MKRRIGYFVMGAFLIGYGVSGLMSGEVAGFGANVSHTKDITYIDNPIEYSLMLLFSFLVGGACLWAAFFEK